MDNEFEFAYIRLWFQKKIIHDLEVHYIKPDRNEVFSLE